MREVKGWVQASPNEHSKLEVYRKGPPIFGLRPALSSSTSVPDPSNSNSYRLNLVKQTQPRPIAL